MSRGLALLLAVTDAVMLLYWSLAGLLQIGLADVPKDWMYAHYDHPEVVAWNWSFLPLDLAFSALGLAAVAASARGDGRWRPLALLSLSLTSVAGLMAIGYWAILGEYDPAWFLPNLVLFAWPLAFMPRLVREMGSTPG